RRPDERADWGESFPEAAESVDGAEQQFGDAPDHVLKPTEPLRLGKTIHSGTEPGAQVIEHSDEAVEQVPCLGEKRAENDSAETGQGSAEVAKGATGRLPRLEGGAGNVVPDDFEEGFGLYLSVGDHLPHRLHRHAHLVSEPLEHRDTASLQLPQTL